MNEVERLWVQRLALYREEKVKQMDEERAMKEDEEYKNDLVRREKERLMLEHRPYIDGFAPKGLSTSQLDPTRIYRREDPQLALTKFRNFTHGKVF